MFLLESFDNEELFDGASINDGFNHNLIQPVVIDIDHDVDNYGRGPPGPVRDNDDYDRDFEDNRHTGPGGFNTDQDRDVYDRSDGFRGKSDGIFDDI